ncbi:MAG: TetR family transcriptional regulator [Aquabacterium sp.]|nr:TetR family transcriptional regulator [Aquabacterium sp.]
MARRTKEQALATRNLLLDAAEEVFHRQGVARSSLDDIARTAGMTRGAVYWHFADKADLFAAMMDRAVLPMEQALRQATDEPGPDAIAAMRQTLIEVLHSVAHEPRIRRALEIAIFRVEVTGDMAAMQARRIAVRAAFLELYERSLARAQASGQIRAPQAARVLALGLFALVDGLTQNWLLQPDGFDLVRDGAAAVDHYLAGLGWQAGAGRQQPAAND